MRSDYVVISWWSNCLGLTCLDRLIKNINNRKRKIYVIQVGKQEKQKELFIQTHC